MMLIYWDHVKVSIGQREVRGIDRVLALDDWNRGFGDLLTFSVPGPALVDWDRFDVALAKALAPTDPTMYRGNWESY